MTINEFAGLFPEIPAADVQYFVETVARAFEETGNIEDAVRLAHRKQVELAEIATKPENQMEMAGVVWTALQA